MTLCPGLEPGRADEPRLPVYFRQHSPLEPVIVVCDKTGWCALLLLYQAELPAY